MILAWEGIQIQVPGTMQPVQLAPGCITLADDTGFTIIIRPWFLPHAFSLSRIYQRLQKAAGLPPRPLHPCRQRWAQNLSGRLFWSEHLWALQFPDTSGLVVALFSRPPSEHEARSLFSSMTWSSPEIWRRWQFRDIALQTPPGYQLQHARLQPGRIQLQWQKNKQTRLLIDRLAPATVILGTMDLLSWTRIHLSPDLGKTLQCHHIDDPHTVEFLRSRPRWQRRFSRWPGIRSQLEGRVRLFPEHNMLLSLIAQGPLLPQSIKHQLFYHYAPINTA